MGSISNSVIWRDFENNLAPHRIFNAILRSLFSAVAELAPLKHPRRPTLSGSLKERTSKAKSNMVAAAIPKISNYSWINLF